MLVDLSFLPDQEEKKKRIDLSFLPDQPDLSFLPDQSEEPGIFSRIGQKVSEVLPSFQKDQDIAERITEVAKTAALPISIPATAVGGLIREIPGVEKALEKASGGASGIVTGAARGDIQAGAEAIKEKRPLPEAVGEAAERFVTGGRELTKEELEDPSFAKQLFQRLPRTVGEIFGTFIDPINLPEVAAGTALFKIPAVAKETPAGVSRLLVRKATKKAASKMKKAGVLDDTIKSFEASVENAAKSRVPTVKQARDLVKQVEEAEIPPKTTPGAPRIAPVEPKAVAPTPTPLGIKGTPPKPLAPLAEVERQLTQPNPPDIIPVPQVSGEIADIAPESVKFTESPETVLKDKDLKTTPDPTTPQQAQQFMRKEVVRDAKQKEQFRADTETNIQNIQNDAEALSLLQKESGQALEGSPIFRQNFVRDRTNEIKGELKKFIQDRIPKEQQATLLSALTTASTPQSLKSVIARTQKASVPETATTKDIVQRTTGVAPERTQVSIREDVALKGQIKAEAKGSKEGFKAGVKEGAKFTKDEMVQRFREGQQKIQDTIEFIKNSLPVEERGRFLTAAVKANTLKKHYSVFARVTERLDDIKAGELRAEIKDFTKPSDKIPVDYQNRLKDIRAGIDLSKPSEAMLTKLRGLKDYIVKNGEPLGINPKKIEALKRLTKKSAKDMTTEELTELRDEVQKLQDLGKLKLELKWKYNVREWKRETQKLVNSTVNMDPTITGIEKFDKAKASALLHYMETVHTMRVADMLDGYTNYKGENVKHIKSLAQAENNSVLSHRNRIADFLEKGKQIKNEWTQDEMDIMAFHIYNEQKAFEQAQSIINDKGWTDPPELTPEMRRMVNLFRETANANVDRVTAVYEEIENKPFQKVNNYFPIKYEKEFNLIGPATIEQGRFRTTQTFKGFTFGRKKNVKRKARTDLFNILDESVSEQEWYTNMQPKLENIKYLVKSKEYGEAAGEIGQNFWNNTLDIVARRGWSATAKSNFFIREGRLNLQKAILGYKLSTIFMQPMAIFDALAYTTSRMGPRASGEVLKEFTKSWLNWNYANQFIKGSPALQTRRGGEEAISETFENAKRSSKFFRAYVEKGMGLLQKSDIITASGIERGVFNTLRRNGLSQEEALVEADFIMNLVSGSNNVVYRPHILSKGEGHRAWFTFQNFFMNRWGVIAHDLIKSGIVRGSPKQKIASAFGLAILMAGNVVEDEARRWIFKLSTGRTFKPNSALATMIMTVPESIPFFGNFIEAAYAQSRGSNFSGGPPIMKVFEDALGGAFRAAFAKKKRSRRQGALKAVEGALTLFPGIPGTAQGFDLLERLSR